MPSVAELLPLFTTLEFRVGYEMEAAGLAKPRDTTKLPLAERATALLAIVEDVLKTRQPPPLKSVCTLTARQAKAILKAAAKEAGAGSKPTSAAKAAKKPAARPANKAAKPAKKRR